jgi:NAD(P)H-quinone oxidoreductase subunit H
MAQLETKTEPMVLNMGPHHPSMHGCFRIIVTLDGEDVVDCEPVIGYLHRGMEKIAENRTNLMYVPYVSRWDYAAGMFYERLITNNPIFRRRVEGIGTISRDTAINWGLSGPMLRASGVKWDLRKVDNYERYDEFDWDVPYETAGDCLARYLVRMGEMRESVKILRQAIDRIPGGAYESLEANRLAAGVKSEWDGFDYQYISKKIAPTFKIPAGEHYVRVESGKGELGIFIIGEDNIFPWRWKIRCADFNNLQILPHLLKGVKVADIVVILGSIDIIMGSVDR